MRLVGGVRNNLIGEDFITAYQCVWDHDESCFIIKGSRIPLVVTTDLVLPASPPSLLLESFHFTLLLFFLLRLWNFVPLKYLGLTWVTDTWPPVSVSPSLTVSSRADFTKHINDNKGAHQDRYYPRQTGLGPQARPYNRIFMRGRGRRFLTILHFINGPISMFLPC
jgi:hypothetical protein